MNSIYEKAKKLYKNRKIILLGSIDNNNYPSINAVLTTKNRNEIKEIYIKTNTSSKHVQQYKVNPKGCIYMFSIFIFKGLLLKGTFEIVRDESIRKSLWNKGDEKYYSKGDEDYCVLKFKADTGRYYSI